MKKRTGILFVLGAVLINIPYALLISTFNYPDILREPAGVVLTSFAAGGDALIATWLFFALAGFPLIFATIMLGRLWESSSKYLVSIATTFGIIGLIAQLVGLLRWVFVVPVLAQNYVAPLASEATREASIVAFQVLNQFGGVLLGEYVGQLFTILSMALFSLVILQTGVMKRWVAWLGGVASIVYLLAQGELFHTVMPAFPVLDIADLAGSLLWIIWLIVLGTHLILEKEEEAKFVV